MRQINVKLPKELKIALKIYAIDHDKSVQDVVAEFVRKGIFEEYGPKFKGLDFGAYKIHDRLSLHK